ncbi:hypothetical protein AABM38_20620 [Heyndrickxia sp. MSNUG]|uniref:hypothetical protein n=1 Tax=Heyndrickxia sp. MSNUG TaxID=3136677 RepID=UPI003C2EE934
MYFETKHKTVFSPRNNQLEPFYSALEKYAPVLGDSRVFEDLIEVYETLDSQEQDDAARN